MAFDEHRVCARASALLLPLIVSDWTRVDSPNVDGFLDVGAQNEGNEELDGAGYGQAALQTLHGLLVSPRGPQTRVHKTSDDSREEPKQKDLQPAVDRRQVGGVPHLSLQPPRPHQLLLVVSSDLYLPLALVHQAHHVVDLEPKVRPVPRILGRQVRQGREPVLVHGPRSAEAARATTSLARARGAVFAPVACGRGARARPVLAVLCVPHGHGGLVRVSKRGCGAGGGSPGALASVVPHDPSRPRHPPFFQVYNAY